MAHAMAAESHGLVEYDDGVLQLTKKSNIKEIANGGHVVKWGSAWYGVKVLCVGTEELCLAMYSSIKLKLPRVELQDIVQCKNKLTCFWEKTDSHCQGMIENDQSEEDPDLTEQNAEWNQLHQSPSGFSGGKEKYLRACILLRKFSNSCGALQPQTLRGTELRKHIATHCVLLNLQEEEVDDLANFLGHANKIHKEHYRMPIVTRDIVRMSQLLEKAQGNCDYDQESQPDVSVLEDINANIHSDQSPPAAISKTSKMKRSVSPTGRVKRVSWSKEERDAATDLFSSFIENGNLPSTKDCFDVIKENPVFRNRSPLQLKSWLSNQLMKERDNERSVKRRRVSTIYWSYEEKQLMYQLFKNHLEARTLPSFNECVAAITQNPILKFRSKETVKAWVFNENRRNRKI